MSYPSFLDSILLRYKKIDDKLMEIDGLSQKEQISLFKEKKNLETIVLKIEKFKSIFEDINLYKSEYESEECSADVKQMIVEDLKKLEKEQEDLLEEIKLDIVGDDSDDNRNVILEIRAGAGGDEAGLFGMDLLKMYQRFSDQNKWSFTTISSSLSDVGGVKECIVSIKGKNVFQKMRFESGTHRVQRVPSTEASNRVHTSTSTVAVLPEVEDVEIEIKDSDIRVDVFRSSGPGGQSVNTTDSAVRITHIPTGIVATQQDEKSQIKNKEKAMKILRSRIYEMEKQARMEERNKERGSQIGTGSRSEKIRTYNFPQNRLTDHRINFTVRNLDEIMKTGKIDPIIAEIIAVDKAEKLANFSYKMED